MAARLTECLQNLNPRYRTALTLRFLQEKSRADCALLLGVKTATFDVLLLRAVRAFKAWNGEEPN